MKRRMIATLLTAMMAVSALGTTVYAEGDKATLDLWHYYDGEKPTEFINKTVEEYNASHDDVEIVVTYVHRNDLMNQYTIGAVSGELPDIGVVDSPDMASFIALGVFEDITEELTAWGELDNFNEGNLNSCRDGEGNLYGLPGETNCLTILCNMDMLEAAGYTEAPATWDEFYEVAKACTDAENGVYGFSMSAIGNEEGTFQMIPWLYAAGGSVKDLESEGSVKAFDFLGKLVADGIMSKEVVNWSQGDAENAFIAGKAAMVECGSWTLSGIDSGSMELPTDNYKYIPFPTDVTTASVGGGANWGVCKGTEHKAEAVEFLTYLQSKEVLADFCEFAGAMPARKDSVELKEIWTQDERYKVFMDILKTSVARGPHPEWPTISEAIYSAEQAVLLGEKTAAEAMADAAAVVNPILAETPIP